jgi:glyoxylase-like metal-dependent hydrolase (beta-lactamase superfamily II)
MELGPMQNFIYLIADPSTREAAVVDPAWDVEAILKTAAESDLRITTVLLTHTHFDHINGVEALLQATDARVCVHKKEAGLLQAALRTGSNIQTVKSGDDLRVGGVTIHFLHTPGHTPGSQCFYVNDRLITGDTLFIRGCGRCDLPGGDAEQMYHSLSHTLKRMDDHTHVYPGHNYAEVPVSTLGEEKKRNPYLLCGSADQFRRMTLGY